MGFEGFGLGEHVHAAGSRLDGVWLCTVYRERNDWVKMSREWHTYR